MGLNTFFKQSRAIAGRTAKDKETAKKQEKSVFDAVKNFERDRAAELKKSLRTTRIMLGGAAAVSLALAFALAGLAPLKTVEPFLMRVDNSTGYTDVVKPFSQNGGTMDETISRYFLTRFTENREGYDWYTIQTLFDAVELMASDDVFREYRNMMYSDFSPLERLKKSNKIQVRVQAVTFLSDDTAQIRFIKAITDADGKPSQGFTPTKWIATVKFEYTPGKISTEAQRQVNPFGLNVVAYKVDPEAVNP